MKRLAPLIFLLTCISLMCGYLFSKMSWLSKVSIGLLRSYKSYRFLRVWWQGALFVFVVLMLLMLLQNWLDRHYKGKTARIIHIIALALACIGLYFTYDDFQHTFSHKLLKERFHIGGYLFWVGWMLISLFFLFSKDERRLIEDTSSRQTI